jgi:hypothetical protein
MTMRAILGISVSAGEVEKARWGMSTWKVWALISQFDLTNGQGLQKLFSRAASFGGRCEARVVVVTTKIRNSQC